jgi:hypothetical protein
MAACRPATGTRFSVPDIEKCLRELASGKPDKNQKVETYLALGFAAHSIESNLYSKPEVKGELGSAKNYFDMVIALDGDNVMAHIGKFNAAGKQKNPEADAIAAEMLQRFPESVDVKLMVGEYFSLNSDDPAFLEQTDQAIKLDPENSLVRIVHGAALTKSGRFSEAEKYLREGMTNYTELQSLPLTFQYDPSDLLVQVLGKLGRPAEIVELLKAKFDRQPMYKQSQWDMVKLGQAMFDSGDFKSAQTTFELAVKLTGPLSANDVRMRALFAQLRAQDGKVDASLFTGGFGNQALKNTLRLQVFLRNSGFDFVPIDGKFEASTREAMEKCFKMESCMNYFTLPDTL